MKTQNTELNFKKDSVVELNDYELQYVNGGSLTGGSMTLGSVIGSIIIISDILTDSNV